MLPKAVSEAAAAAAAVTGRTTVPAWAAHVSFKPTDGSVPQRGCVGRHLVNRNEMCISGSTTAMVHRNTLLLLLCFISTTPLR